MNPGESIEDLSNLFLHLCYEFPEEDVDWDFFKQKFQFLVHVSLHDELEPPNVSTSPTLANRETPLISKEEFTTPFVLYPPPFPVPMRVSPCDNNKVGKSLNQVPNPYSHSSSTFHDSDPMEKIPEWLMKPMVKTNSSILQDDITIHNYSLESDLDFCYPLSSTCHESLYRDPPDQPNPPSNFPHSLNF